jgi:mannose-1-phosphate guanylyltransferase / mannose-6-phosphate isomerase
MVDSVIILAGGSGTRLWPASTRLHPKQFMDPGTGTSLLQATLLRAGAVTPDGRVVIVTGQDHLGGVVEQIRTFRKASPGCCPDVTILPEPAGRNTAPAIAYGVSFLSRCPGLETGVTAVLAADHIIESTEQFTRDVERASSLARDGLLVTFGIRPTRPETGYGYIEVGEQYGQGHRVATFREKPERAVAQKYLESGRYLWNSGMFVFRNDTFRTELSTYSPDIEAGFWSLGDEPAIRPVPDSDPGPEHAHEAPVLVGDPGETVKRVYTGMPKISIDYAVMEASKHAAVVEASFSWNDVGSWDELASVNADRPPSVPVYTAGAEGSYVYSDIPVALCGVDNLIVVVKNNVVLVCKKGEAQRVREIVEQIQDEGQDSLL